MPFPRKTLSWAAEIKEKLSPFLRSREKIDTETIKDLETTVDELFPGSKKEAIETFSSLVRKIENPTPKKITATVLYNSFHLRYGFQGSLETENWTPWPDECDTVNCYGHSIANYVVAKACGLKPILVEFVGLQKEGQTERGGHSLVVVDVGTTTPEPWIIDQPMGMYGPVTIENGVMTVKDLATKKKRTHQKDYQTKIFGFIQNIASDEERIVKQVEQLRLHPETVLYPGQRVEVLFADKWQSEKALEVPWYIKFISDRSGKSRGDVVSRIILERPGIKSRGLEYRLTLDQEGSLEKEKVIGYYCDGMIWTDFVNPVPMVELAPEQVAPLLGELNELSCQFSNEFEMYLMEKSCLPLQADSLVFRTDYIKAARDSFENLQKSEYGGLVSAFSIVEALYQYEKGDKQTYLNPSEREQAIKKFKRVDHFFRYYTSAKKALEFTSRVKEKLENKPFMLVGSNQLETPRIRAFLSLETEEERLQHILEHKPNFIDDAVDRLVFYQRKIKGKEGRIDEIAKSTFDNYEDARFGGYVRIFAEFLGHIAMTWPNLSLEKYKEKIINKLT